MANVKLHPADHNKNFGTLGIKLPMNSNRKYNKAECFNMSYTTEEQAVSNYINLLLTKSGERYMQPEFGVGLYYYIFEQNSDIVKHRIQDAIETQSRQWLPYIINDSIIIKDFDGLVEDSKHGINIVIKFRVTESGANKTISIFPGLKNTIDVEIQ